MSYVKPGPLERETEDRYISEKQDRARRSTETFRAVTSTTSMDKPFYWSKIDSGVHKAAIYNDTGSYGDTDDKVRFFTDGVEVATVHINRGESFTDCFYDEGCDHSYGYVLRDIGYVAKLGFNASLTQLYIGRCSSLNGADCVATSSYKVSTDGNGVGDLSYTWTVIGGTISSGNGTDTIVVVTTGSEDVNLYIKVDVADDYTITTVDMNAVHSRSTKYDEVVINGLVELSPGSCDHFFEDTCSATSSYYVDAGNVDSYYWTVDGAVIDSGQGTNTIVVKSIDNVSTVVNVKCTCMNIDGSSRETVDGIYIHRRTDVYVPIANIGIVELVAGSCSYQTGSTCTANGQYQMTIDGTPTSVEWVVTGGNLVSGQDTDTVIVSTDSDSNDTVILTVEAKDANNTLIANETFIHTRTETIDPVAIVSLTENVSGSCEYFTGNTCVAASEYTVVATDYDTLLWEVTNGVIQDGQGTDTIIVSSDSDIDVELTVKCTASGLLGGAVSKTEVYTHTRTEVQDVYDQALLYDINNIATEFPTT